MNGPRISLADFWGSADPAYREMLEDNRTQAWGPVVKTQFDSHSEPIQTYTTALLRTPAGEWIFVCQTVDLATDHDAHLQVAPSTRASASRWLIDNRFSLPPDFAPASAARGQKTFREKAANPDPPAEEARESGRSCGCFSPAPVFHSSLAPSAALQGGRQRKIFC